MRGFDYWIVFTLGVNMLCFVYLALKYKYLHTLLIKTMKRHEDHLKDIYTIIKEVER